MVSGVLTDFLDLYDVDNNARNKESQTKKRYIINFV